MLNKIKTDAILSKFIEKDCCENDICVTFDKSIPADSYVIIKVDKFYNSLKLEEPPPSIDCLIIRKCINSGYGITLVELKKIKTGKGLDIENIKGKFETTLFDFIKTRFSKILNKDFQEIKLYFVTRQEIYKRDLGLKMEVLINLKIKYDDKILMIIPKMPTPTIKNCYG